MSSEMALSSNMFGDKCCNVSGEEGRGGEREERGGAGKRGGEERRGGEGRKGEGSAGREGESSMTGWTRPLKNLLNLGTRPLTNHQPTSVSTPKCYQALFSQKVKMGLAIYKTTPIPETHPPGRRHTPQAGSSSAPECRGTLRPVRPCV